MTTVAKQEKIQRFDTDQQALAQARLLFVNLGTKAPELLRNCSQESYEQDFPEPPPRVQAHEWRAVVDCGRLATEHAEITEENTHRARRIAHHFAIAVDG